MLDEEHFDIEMKNETQIDEYLKEIKSGAVHKKKDN